MNPQQLSEQPVFIGCYWPCWREATGFFLLLFVKPGHYTAQRSDTDSSMLSSTGTGSVRKTADMFGEAPERRKHFGVRGTPIFGKAPQHIRLLTGRDTDDVYPSRYLQRNLHLVQTRSSRPALCVRADIHHLNMCQSSVVSYSGL